MSLRTASGCVPWRRVWTPSCRAARSRAVGLATTIRDARWLSSAAFRPLAGGDCGISSATDIMREEIAMIPRLLAEQLEALAEPVRQLARRLTHEGVEHLYMTGCGDSAFAGDAAALAYQKHAGVDAERVHALELARYRVRYLPERSAF